MPKEKPNEIWYPVIGLLIFGGMYLHNIKYKIITEQDGFTIYSLLKSETILWRDIKSLNYESSYNTHGVELKLIIMYGQPQKSFAVSVKQFKKKPMQQFYEILNEQCENAKKNDHFIKLATGNLNWKEQLKMY